MPAIGSNIPLDHDPLSPGKPLPPVRVMATGASALTLDEGASAATALESPFRAAEAVNAAPVEERPGRPSEAGQRVARNFGVLFGGQAITWTMTLLWTLIVPRALGPVGLGILVSAQSVAGVLGIVLGMGTRNYLVRETVIDPSRRVRSSWEPRSSSA